VDVADDQKHGCPGEIDDPEKPLQAYATQHGYYSNRCSQAEDRDRVSGPNGLHDLPPQFPAQCPCQGDDRPADRTPHLLGSEADHGQGDKIEYGAGGAATASGSVAVSTVGAPEKQRMRS
jgi:hypothetical protein